MQKHILVKTPLTTNGQDLVFDENDKKTYTESILVDNPGKGGARAILEQRNSTLPQGLKMVITDYVPPVEEQIATAPVALVQGTSMLDQLKLQAENEKLKAQLAKLQTTPTITNVTDTGSEPDKSKKK